MAFSGPEASSGEDRFSRCLEAARAGSPEALGALLEMFRPYLLHLGNQQLDVDLQAKVGASDLVQETFLEAQRSFSGFRGLSEAELVAWLRQILINNFANLRRHYRDTDKREVQREVGLPNPPAADQIEDLAVLDSPSSQARARERDEALHRALQLLPERSRLVIQWRSYERLSFEEVGTRIGRSADAARKLWIRAIERLQQLLERRDETL
jgi:RNA polymerase sigma-70 factor (ECF subfamily)